MILNAENWELLVSKSPDSVVVAVDMGYLQAGLINGLGVAGETRVLGDESGIER